MSPGGEQELERFCAVAHHHDGVEDLVLFEGAKRQGFVTRVVFDQQYALLTHERSLSSSVKKNTAPWSTLASAQILPPCRRTMRCTVASPTPVPSNSLGRWSR